MKIALIKRRCSLRVGGSERYCVVLARRLISLGHDVMVIGESMDEPLHAEIPFTPVRVNRLTSWTANRSFAENAGNAARCGGFDVVYGLGRAFGIDAVRVTERLQAHWVNVRYKGGLSRQLQLWNPRHRTLIELERTIYQADSTRRIITQSELDRKLLNHYYDIPDTKIHTIANGVDTSVFHPGVREERNTVRAEFRIPRSDLLLSFASMDFEGKGLRSILQAIARLQRDDVWLLVLGKGPVRRFQKIAERFGIARRVLFAGRRDRIERYYGASDLFVLPTAYEPFPNVNLEALACGTPVITTRNSAMADVLTSGQTGYFVSGIDAVEEIETHIASYLSKSEADRNVMSGRCCERAREFTIERNVQKTVEVLEETARETQRLRNVG